MDIQGQRELLAGFELELGDERAKTELCNIELRQEKQANLRYALGGGFIGAGVGTMLTLLLVFVANK